MKVPYREDDPVNHPNHYTIIDPYTHSPIIFFNSVYAPVIFPLLTIGKLPFHESSYLPADLLSLFIKSSWI